MSTNNELYVPFRGTLRRSTWSDENTSQCCHPHPSSSSSARAVFTIPVPLRDERGSVQKLLFERDHYERMHRLFQIVDSSGRGTLQRKEMEEFVTLRCPSFRRRDEAMWSMASCSSTSSRTSDIPFDINNNNYYYYEKSHSIRNRDSCAIGKNKEFRSTFDEMWYSVAEAGMGYKYSRMESTANAIIEDGDNNNDDDVSVSLSSRCSSECFVFDDRVEFGLEAWMVFCRLISMLQYQEAKRHFNRHQPREEDADACDRVIVIDVHPPAPPEPLNVEALLCYERRWTNMSASLMSSSTNDILPATTSKSHSSLPPPELDLNHCLLAAHEPSSYSAEPLTPRTRIKQFANNLRVSVTCIDGPLDPDCTNSSSTSLQHLDFVLTLTPDKLHLEKYSSDASVNLGVRRKLSDFEWLHKEFASHQQIGGTLCGRIIPAFPKVVEIQSSSLKGSIISLAKSLYSKATTKIRSSSIESEESSRSSSGKDDLNISERSASIERYLNFLLGHPALSTSFPLNAILKANQGGLDAAKSILEEINNQKAVSSSAVDKAFELYYSFDRSSHPSFLQSAARAAVTLKLHGILDASGMPTASFRLQHASLPKFDFRSLREGNSNHDRSTPPPSLESSRSEENENGFESGVVPIESELDDEYDLLPLPSPNDKFVSDSQVSNQNDENKEANYFHYGHDSTFGVGGVSVDDDIDKLREIIGNLDSAIVRLRYATRVISKSNRKRSILLRSVAKGLTSFNGLDKEFGDELSFHIPAIEESINEEISCSVILNEELSWQSSLSSAAVNAAEDVRSACRAARTAASAKSAAELAAINAQNAYTKGHFPDTSELKAAKVRVEMSQSHAVHAAVVNHEAFVAKRKAAVALAHDIRYWNSCRKQDLMKACLQSARSQLKTSKSLAKSWRELSDKLKMFQNDDTILDNISEIVTPDIVNDSIVDDKHVHISDRGHFTLSASAELTYPKQDEHQAHHDIRVISDAQDDKYLSDGMTASMQSLVDGLMVWGGRFIDPQDEAQLPNDMTMHIAMEESDIVSTGDDETI